jgi:hypothetical protein
VQLLAESDANNNIQYECAWCLTNMACGEKHHVQALLDAGLVELALELMVVSDRDDVR